ncbi:MAG: UDP-N-acetylmuramoyl-L-alanine--D-glutamate ligase [Alphaproteobacteria bacterium]|nr:UDP-N-acetylmuramoyl-L-alanine--D-glutamate ligase [Alphaproteobacteria bacterium]
MIQVPFFRGQTVAVFGLARSGLATARALLEGGAHVIAWDDSEKGRKEGSAQGLHLAEPASWDWPRIAALILSPGVPLTHPAPHAVVKAAQAAGAEIIGDVELFMRALAADPVRSAPENSGRVPLICVTGTNGKSTTTALIAHLLQRNGFIAQAGGNIGRPVLDLDAPAPGIAYVLEVSSFQIDLTPSLKPDAGVLTNITPDHLDRHGTMDAYVAVKRRLFAKQTGGDVAVIGVDDEFGADSCTLITAKGGPLVIPVSVGQVLGRGIYVIDGVLFDAMDSPAAPVVDLKVCPGLPGPHNWQNAGVAYAAVRHLVRDPREIGRAMATFPGLAHRIETVGRLGKVRFINDSKATNADAAAKALACFENIHWIIGGIAKSGGIESLTGYFPRVAKAYLIGKAQDDFARTIDGAVAYERCGDLETAMRRATAEALQSAAIAPVVLLSPACASFDQFKDFEDRGESFRRIAQQLIRDAGEGQAA